MIRGFRIFLVGLSVVFFSLGSFSSPAKMPEPKPYYGKISKKIAKMLPATHLLQEQLDDGISVKAWTNLVTMYDYDHSFFLQSDLDSFERMKLKVDDEIREGKVDFGFEVYRVFRSRVESRYTFVTNTLAKPFDFTVKENYTWKRKNAPWPKTVQEQDDLWRKRIKNEMLIQLISRELDKKNKEEEAKKKKAEPETVSQEPKTDEKPAVGAKAAETVEEQKSVAKKTDQKLNADANVATNTPPPPPLTPKESIEKRYKQLMIVFQDMDEESILQRYLSAVATAYDPHTDYMSPTRKEDFDIDMNLMLCGIGATLRAEDGMAKIVDVIPGGPAGRDKRPIRLVKGDKIIGVGQGDHPIEDILHLPLDKSVRKIRGKKGSKVVLNVIPASDPSGTTTKLVDLIRDEVKLEQQAATGHVAQVTLPNGRKRALGIVRLPAFYGTMGKKPFQEGYRSATDDVAKQIALFNSQNVEGLILDLRNNGGGSLVEAIRLTGLFVRSGPAVQVREPRQIIVLPVPNTDSALSFNKPMIVLINRTSASASEIVAGALQDYGRALIIGDHQTHGKGSVQSVMSLGDEKFGSIKITTASFYRITGSSTQLRGVQSDIVIPSVWDGMEEIGEDKLPYALPWTQIEQALFVPVANPKKYLPKLKANSAVRLANNPKYQQHCRLIHRAEKVYKQTEVPLEMNARRKMMEAENEARKQEEKQFEANKDKESDEDDVVLMEALNILSDWITESGGGEIPMETEGDLRSRMLRIFGQAL